MLKTEQAAVQEEGLFEILNMYNDLLKEWWYDLNFEEQKIWLWNAKTEMRRIKYRR